jgi:hypothetical protein
MKNNIKTLILLACVTLTLGSCGVNSGLINQVTTYNNGTNVVLQEANYKVIGTFSGEASTNYFLGFGGFTNLVSEAKKDLYQKAGLEGTSRAIINMSLEMQKDYYTALFQERTVIVHGTVIEFTK